MLTPTTIYTRVIRTSNTGGIATSYDLCICICAYSRAIPFCAKFWTVFALPYSKGGSTPQKLYPLDHACLAARHPDKFGDVAPPNPKVIGVHTPNFKQNFEFWLSPKKFLGAPQFLNLNYKVPHSSHCLAKFDGDRRRGFRDFAPKPFTHNIFLGEAPQI